VDSAPSARVGTTRQRKRGARRIVRSRARSHTPRRALASPRARRLQFDPVVRQHVLFNEAKMPKGRGGRRAGK